jgi:serpin B
MMLDNQTLIHHITTANTGFGLRVLAQIAGEEPKENIFISPLSISLALAMTYNGAVGKTHRDMQKNLGWGRFSTEKVNAAFAALLPTLTNPDPQVELAIANAIWALTGLQLHPEYIQRVQETFASRVDNLNFPDPDSARVINEWVAEQTRQKISALVTPELVQQAILILVNALYFKGLWSRPFDPQRTYAGEFILSDGTRESVPMMSQSGRFAYLEDDTFQAICLPYGDRRVSMYVFLPKPEVPLSAFAQHLKVRNWNKWMYSFEETEGTLMLPRFKSEYSTELKQVLSSLGMEIAFGPQADFSGMGMGALMISAVIHKTFVEVNEEGTEAAAATAVTMLRGFLPRSFQMVVNRPFFCAICDNETGAILFIGYILDPM